MIQIVVDDQPVLQRLREIGADRQQRFVLSKGLNLIAKAVQSQLRLMEQRTLNLRRPSWVLQQVKISGEDWARKNKLSVTLHLTDRSAFLSRLETGERHTPFRGKWVVIPNPQVFGDKIIRASDPLHIKNLHLRRTPHGVRGDERTFVIRMPEGPAIMQRVEYTHARNKRDLRKIMKVNKGANAKGTRLLYWLRPDVAVPIKLTWYDTAKRTAARASATAFEIAMQDAINTAK